MCKENGRFLSDPLDPLATAVFLAYHRQGTRSTKQRDETGCRDGFLNVRRQLIACKNAFADFKE
jgi:hypothetical protein